MRRARIGSPSTVFCGNLVGGRGPTGVQRSSGPSGGKAVMCETGDGIWKQRSSCAQVMQSYAYA